MGEGIPLLGRGARTPRRPRAACAYAAQRARAGAKVVHPLPPEKEVSLKARVNSRNSPACGFTADLRSVRIYWKLMP